MDGENTFLRDELAIDRTILANERTLLAYFRTTLALLAAGGTVVHFLQGWWVGPVGWGLLVAGPLLFGLGIWRYRQVSRHLRQKRLGL